MAHNHTCIDCGAQIGTDDDGCEIDSDHDFGRCDRCAATDVTAVEYYDQLDEAARSSYRAGTVGLNAATLAEMDRIDFGLKARCLS